MKFAASPMASGNPWTILDMSRLPDPSLGSLRRGLTRSESLLVVKGYKTAQ
jgi:hypothetical protein